MEETPKADISNDAEEELFADIFADSSGGGAVETAETPGTTTAISASGPEQAEEQNGDDDDGGDDEDSEEGEEAEDEEAALQEGESPIPPGAEARQKALLKLPEEELRGMLQNLGTPTQGDKEALVIRLIRRLANLPPIAADAKLFEEGHLDEAADGAATTSHGGGGGRGDGSGRGRGSTGARRAGGRGRTKKGKRRCKIISKKKVGVLQGPSVEADVLTHLSPGDVFAVVEERVDPADSRKYWRLADGRGWVPECSRKDPNKKVARLKAPKPEKGEVEELPQFKPDAAVSADAENVKAPADGPPLTEAVAGGEQGDAAQAPAPEVAAPEPVDPEAAVAASLAAMDAAEQMVDTITDRIASAKTIPEVKRLQAALVRYQKTGQIPSFLLREKEQEATKGGEQLEIQADDLAEEDTAKQEAGEEAVDDPEDMDDDAPLVTPTGPRSGRGSGGQKGRRAGRSGRGMMEPKVGQGPEAPPNPEDLPPDTRDQYSALVHLPMMQLRAMLKQVWLPTEGTKQQLAVRLVRDLASLPPTEADKQLFEQNRQRSKVFAPGTAGRAAGDDDDDAPLSLLKGPSKASIEDFVRDFLKNADLENTRLRELKQAVTEKFGDVRRKMLHRAQRAAAKIIMEAQDAKGADMDVEEEATEKTAAEEPESTGEGPVDDQEAADGSDEPLVGGACTDAGELQDVADEEETVSKAEIKEFVKAFVDTRDLGNTKVRDLLDALNAKYGSLPEQTLDRARSYVMKACAKQARTVARNAKRAMVEANEKKDEEEEDEQVENEGRDGDGEEEGDDDEQEQDEAKEKEDNEENEENEDNDDSEDNEENEENEENEGSDDKEDDDHKSDDEREKEQSDSDDEASEKGRNDDGASSSSSSSSGSDDEKEGPVQDGGMEGQQGSADDQTNVPEVAVVAVDEQLVAKVGTDEAIAADQVIDPLNAAETAVLNMASQPEMEAEAESNEAAAASPAAAAPDAVAGKEAGTEVSLDAAAEGQGSTEVAKEAAEDVTPNASQQLAQDKDEAGEDQDDKATLPDVDGVDEDEESPAEMEARMKAEAEAREKAAVEKRARKEAEAEAREKAAERARLEAAENARRAHRAELERRKREDEAKEVIAGIRKTLKRWAQDCFAKEDKRQKLVEKGVLKCFVPAPASDGVVKEHLERLISSYGAKYVVVKNPPSAKVRTPAEAAAAAVPTESAAEAAAPVVDASAAASSEAMPAQGSAAEQMPVCDDAGPPATQDSHHQPAGGGDATVPAPADVSTERSGETAGASSQLNEQAAEKVAVTSTDLGGDAMVESSSAAGPSSHVDEVHHRTDEAKDAAMPDASMVSEMPPASQQQTASPTAAAAEAQSAVASAHTEVQVEPAPVLASSPTPAASLPPTTEGLAEQGEAAQGDDSVDAAKQHTDPNSMQTEQMAEATEAEASHDVVQAAAEAKAAASGSGAIGLPSASEATQEERQQQPSGPKWLISFDASAMESFADAHPEVVEPNIVSIRKFVEGFVAKTDVTSMKVKDLFMALEQRFGPLRRPLLDRTKQWASEAVEKKLQDEKKTTGDPEKKQGSMGQKEKKRSMQTSQSEAKRARIETQQDVDWAVALLAPMGYRGASSAEQIPLVRPPAEVVQPILAGLEELSKKEGFRTLMRTTQIGKAVNSARKHPNPEIAKAAKGLVAEWKVAVSKK